MNICRILILLEKPRIFWKKYLGYKEMLKNKTSRYGRTRGDILEVKIQQRGSLEWRGEDVVGFVGCLLSFSTKLYVLGRVFGRAY